MNNIMNEHEKMIVAKKLTTYISAWVDLIANDPTKTAETDVVSNYVSGINSEVTHAHETLAKQLTENPEKLRLLLHEKTHHVSFDSPVGRAFSALVTSSASFALTEIALEEKLLSVSKRDRIILQIIYTMMRPLIEGLAVFAEHDVIPRNSPVASKIVLTTARLIAPELLKWISTLETIDISKIFAAEIQKQRMTEHWLERKIHLLEQSINGECHYLLGYLAVKGIYSSLLQKSPKLQDSDLFMLLMQDYWFYDYKYAEMLLNLGKEKDAAFEYSTVSAEILLLVEYFWDRMENLYKNVDKYTKECEDYFSKISSNEPSYRNFSIRTRFDDLHGLRVAPLEIKWTFPKIFNYRTVFRFSSQEIKIAVDKDGKVTIKDNNDKQILSCIAVKNAMRGNYKGSMEGVLYYQNNKIEESKILNIISGGDGLVAIQDIENNTWNSLELINYFDNFPSTYAIASGLGYIESFNDTRDFLNRNTELKEMYNHYKEENGAAIESHYMQLAFRRNGEESKHLINLLSINDNRKGFCNIFNDEQLKKIAKWSLMCGSGFWDISDYPEKELILNEIDLLNELGKNKLGFNLFTCFKKDAVIAVRSLV